jgi:hypothetical protein
VQPERHLPRRIQSRLHQRVTIEKHFRPAERVSDACNSYHPCCDDSAYQSQFLEDRSFLRDHRNACRRVQRQKQPQRPPLPGRPARCAFCDAVGPAFWLPTVGRVLHEMRQRSMNSRRPESNCQSFVGSRPNSNRRPIKTSIYGIARTRRRTGFWVFGNLLAPSQCVSSSSKCAS